MRGVGQLTLARCAGGRGSGVGACAMLRVAVALVLITTLTAGVTACGRGGPKLGERVIPLGQPVPKGGGRFLVGEPYDIAGTTYYPREDANYDRTGQASWYGELFHGRYTANGEIYVQTHQTEIDGQPWVAVSVTDTGPGIHEDDLPHLFERFYRGQAGIKSGSPGTGLGLAIVKEIVDRHAGRIEVDNNPINTSGARFRLLFPA